MINEGAHDEEVRKQIVKIKEVAGSSKDIHLN